MYIPPIMFSKFSCFENSEIHSSIGESWVCYVILGVTTILIYACSNKEYFVCIPLKN